LLLAIRYSNINIVTLLLQAGADPNQCSLNDLSPLHVAVQNDQPHIAELLLQYEAEINVQAGSLGTPLDIAQGRPGQPCVPLLSAEGKTASLQNRYFPYHRPHNELVSRNEYNAYTNKYYNRTRYDWTDGHDHTYAAGSIIGKYISKKLVQPIQHLKLD